MGLVVALFWVPGLAVGRAARLHGVREVAPGPRVPPGTRPWLVAAVAGGVLAQRVVPPTYLTAEDADLRYVRRHLVGLGTDARLCEALDRLGVGYLYVDPAPWNTLPTHPDPRAAPEQAVRRLDAGGSAVLYEITAC